MMIEEYVCHFKKRLDRSMMATSQEEAEKYFKEKYGDKVLFVEKKM